MTSDLTRPIPTASTILRRLPSTSGLVGAAVGYAAALTPSLLPVPMTFLLILTSVGSITGYAIGTTIEWAVRKVPAIAHWSLPRWIRAVILAGFWIPAIAFTPIAVGWQLEQQEQLSMQEPISGSLVVAGATVVIAAVLVMVGRLIRVGADSLGGLLARWLPVPVRWTRLIVAVVLLVLMAAGIQGTLSWLVSSYDSKNADASGQEATDLGINSGSADSLTPWSTLGREGRFYVSNTMTPERITAITGRPAQRPTRVYVGMQQGDTPQARTDLALQELDRVDAWSRKYLVIFGVTGTGWVDPDAINSLEAVTDGDVTTVAVQYSAVPSWIGFVIDPQTTVEQNANTIDGVLAAWRQLPEDSRPELILFGQSLGSLGTQGAWSASTTPEEVTREIPHVVWMGPPAESVLWKSWQATRTGGPAWEPIVGDNRIVRVLVSADDPDGAEAKTPPTIVFAAHANDPVVYWSPSLLFSQPDWLEPPLGPGVMPQMRWMPIITFLQVGMDLISGGEPPEVGHNYSANMAVAVALAVQPPGWTHEQTLAVQAALPSLRYVTG